MCCYGNMFDHGCGSLVFLWSGMVVYPYDIHKVPRLLTGQSERKDSWKDKFRPSQWWPILDLALIKKGKWGQKPCELILMVPSRNISVWKLSHVAFPILILHKAAIYILHNPPKYYIAALFVILQFLLTCKGECGIWVSGKHNTDSV